MTYLALKTDVDTLRGTREGVPRLARLFRRCGADATFFFSVGPDHTGRALSRVFQPGFVGKISRTSVLKHYGVKTLLYGTLLPGPDIGRNCGGVLRAIQADGFEVGLHAYDHVRWQNRVMRQGADWTRCELQRGIERFEALFRNRPKAHAAAGWQMNPDAFALEAQLGFDFASDTRGTHPFLPLISGKPGSCVQIPTTLPTLDELIGVNGASESDVVSHLLAMTANVSSCGHVFTLHAELEGMRLLPVLEALLKGWVAQGYSLVSLRTLFESLDRVRLPCHQPIAAPFPGRSFPLMCQALPGALPAGAARRASQAQITP